MLTYYNVINIMYRILNIVTHSSCDDYKYDGGGAIEKPPPCCKFIISQLLLYMRA